MSIKLAIAMMVISSCNPPKNSLPYYHTAMFTPLWPNETVTDIDTLHSITNFSFTDQDGTTITNDTFKGKVYVANFFFTICPGVCPRLTANMRSVAEAFSSNAHVKFISHSVTPGIDSVSRLKKYADDYDIDSRQWHLVTGNKQEIYDLARRSYFAEQEQGFQSGSDGFLHTEHFLLVDTRGHLRGIYKGTLPAEMSRLKEDIDILLSEGLE